MASKTYIFIFLFLLFLQGAVLAAMGHLAICDCGYVEFWHGAVDAGNSQHLTDWYTFSHIIHGFLFYAAVYFIARGRWPFGLMLLVAMLPEIVWEIIENTPLIIDRYRQTTVSIQYFGDSAINSVFDTLAAALGFVIASKLRWWKVLILAIVMELFVGYLIRDNLTLNVLMLTHPIESVREWQANEL
jgi:hypothetical protein